MIIRNIQEAEAALLPYVPLVAELSGKDTTLDRIKPVMKLLGHPEQSLRVVHIAGTSGKTSTAYYASSLLTAAGQKTGLTVSPHVDSITERIQINGKPITEAVFCEKLAEFLEIIQSADQRPSYFELMYSFAMWVMVQEKVDYAVIETGVGGLHDATNVAKRPDKVCVITDIGFDHMRLLGNTLPEIAAQKIGIMHPGNVGFSYPQTPEIMKVYEQWVDQQGAKLHVIAEPKDQTEVPGLPLYQQRNWILANQVFVYIQKRDNLKQLTNQELLETQHVAIPGRMETKVINGKTIIMDGAHNAQKMTSFVESFQQLHPGIKPVVLLALKADKDYEQVLSLLGPFADRIISTAFKTTQDLPVHSMDPAKLAEAFMSHGFQAEAIPEQAAAVRTLLEDSNPVSVITGSFYLLSQIRKSKLIA